MAAPTWRFPLQTGEGAVRALWWSAVLWLPGFVLFVVLWFASFSAEWLFTLLILPGLLVMGFAQRNLRRARRMQPSDLELEPDRLRIRGGPHDGFDIPFSKLERVFVRRATTVLPQFFDLLPRGDDERDEANDLHVLFLQKKTLELKAIAMTRAPGELASFEELAATLQGMVQPKPETEGAPLPQQVLRCPSCRGPVAPSADAEVSCAWCSQQLSMPVSLQEKVRAAAVVASHSHEAVKAVLEQPSARSLDRTFRNVTRALMAAWGVGGVSILVSELNGRSLLSSVGFSSVFVFGAVTGGFSIFRYLLVDRQALRVLTLQLAALGSEKDGTPRSCRQCRGPLVAAADQLVVSCVYCDAPNVMGVDLRGRAAVVGEEARSLEQVLEQRTSRRKAWRAVAMLGAVLIVAGVGTLGWAILGR